ncbi:hypothetical protein NM208_g1145 [Fusarium decemcellulare]|uniref:Uncharacterized protein n=1 Tax=Fusarium decemcellulare TaxID=57161 RepID=A0ACC1SXE1_9HYPO|nr:hypothetical protein NM208_g1145 [Fusarium decemcellulare]
MPKRSNRTPTVIERTSELEQTGTVRQLLQLFTRGNIRRVTLSHYSLYRSKLISDRGSQFIVYSGDGVNTFGEGHVVVKCVRLKLGDEPLSRNDKNREQVLTLYKEVQILTHPQLRTHSNIPSLLWYDFVDAGDSKFIPALVMERATLGSLSALLRRNKENLAETAQMKICADVTSGLLALHKTGIVHGDVKTDNVLIFNSVYDDGYLAKISDFGSAIIINLDPSADQTSSWKYYGTPATNAPEVADQTTSKLGPADLRKCDKLLAGLSEQGRANVARIFQKLLTYDCKARCEDLSTIEHILRPCSLVRFDKYGVSVHRYDYELTSKTSMSLTGSSTHRDTRPRDDDDIATALRKTLGLEDYLDIYFDLELESERDTQALILSRLQRDAKSEESLISAKALFQLAIASSCGFGTPYSEDEVLQYTVSSARKGYLPAMAVAYAFHLALERQDELDLDEQTDWLFEATAWGSHIAGTCLGRLSPTDFDDARKAFHRAGGFNQFFYPQDPPSYIHSEEFSSGLTKDRSGLEELAQSAAIYGDVVLLNRLIKDFNLDPDLTNCWGESLVVLCCKGGHVKVLKFLLDCGAGIVPDDYRECPLHWLIAFDVDEVKEAAELLTLKMAWTEATSDMVWNHPSIDLPGRLLLGSPFHYASFFDSSAAIFALLNHTDLSPSWQGSSEISPLEYAITRRKVHASKELISKGALKTQDKSRNVLAEIGMTLVPETWVAMALTGMSRLDLANRCVDMVVSEDKSLLDASDKTGFTPAMGASLYHDEASLAALIKAGCNLNLQTPAAYDNRTALNLASNLKIQWSSDDNTVELLLENGADLVHRAKVGGKLAIHFAARDDNANFAAKLLSASHSGSDVDAQTEPYGQTPLHIAAEYGSVQVAAVLLDSGADPDATQLQGTYNKWNWNNLTPLAIATCLGRNTIVQLLVKNGASGLARPPSGHTVLHLAAVEPDGGEALRLVLDIPALKNKPGFLDHQADRGVTAMHLCAGKLGMARQLKMLLSAGADPNIPTASGHSVLDVALDTRRQLLEFMESFMVALSTESVEELARILPSSGGFWETLVAAGNVYSLSIGEGEAEQIIQIGKRTRYQHPGGGQATDSRNEVVLEEGEVAVSEDGEDDPVVISLQDEMVKLDGSIQFIENAGGMSLSAESVPEGLVSLYITAE